VQGRSVLKRFLVSVAIAAASVLAFGAASALACEGLQVDKTEATAGETVNFTLVSCQVDDNWQLAVFFEKPGSEDATPEKRVLAAGFAEDTTVTGDFSFPDEIGDAAQDVTLTMFVIRDGQQLPNPPELQMRYLGPAAGDTGPSGASGSTGTTGDDFDFGPTDAGIITPLPKRITRQQQRKKDKAAAKQKDNKTPAKKTPAKAKPKKKPKVTPFTPAPSVPTATPLPKVKTPAIRAGALPPATSTPPPGVSGPPAANGTPPSGGTPIEPITPPRSSPATPVAATTPKDDNSLGVPVWLVVVLGLMTLLGLGGAQTRMLGIWGPQPPPGRTSDARLLALQRVTQSGAAYQKQIAELKEQTKHRSRVG
jgi:hypothetical protein